MSTITAQDLAAALALLGITVEGPAQPEAAAPAKPAEPATKSYRERTDRQKEASHRKVAEVNARWNMKLAGGSRKVSDLSATDRKKYDAEIRACWTKGAGKTITR